MDIKRIFKKDYIIGLDIGASSMKIVQFAKKEGGERLIKADLREIKPVRDEVVRGKEIISVLKELFRGIDIKKSQIIVSINCPETAVKITKTPYMPKPELREAIKLEAKNYFPFPIDDSFLDYEILADTVEKGVRKYDVAVSVSPKATIEKYLSLLKKAGIKPVSFVSCPYAMQKLVEHSYTEEGKTLCFVDIGKNTSDFFIFKEKTLIFSRKIPVTGEDFTKAMTGVLTSDRGKTELTLGEAEKIKKEIGIPPKNEVKIIDGKISVTQILAMLRAPLERLAGEMERGFDYYREESAGGMIDSIVLFGGGAALRGLAKFLSEELGIRVILGDVLEGLKFDSAAIKEKDKVSYQLEFAVGAALSEGKGLNLLPPEIKEETRKVVKRGTIEAITTAVVLVSVFLYIGMKIKLNNFEKRISVAKMEFFSLQSKLKKVEAHYLSNKILIDEPYWEDVFKEISNIIPGSIYFTKLGMKNKIIKMEGIVVSEKGQELLSDFILALEKGIFENVRLVKIKEMEKKRQNEFELKCWLD